MTISIIGSSITQFGELWDKSLIDLAKQAVDESLTDAKLEHADIEAVFVANMSSHVFDGQAQLGALVSQFFPHYPSAFHSEASCASGSMALLSAQYALLSGRYTTVMVVGVEKMTDAPSSDVTQMLSGAAKKSEEEGSTFPALYALLAQIHMSEFGTSREMLSAVAVQNHEHAFQNPHAQYHKHLTQEIVSNSTLVAPPLRLLDCSPITDGASALILTTKPVKNAVQILGRGHGQDSLDLASREKLTTLQATVRASREAFSEAKLDHKKIQVIEVHDCFTIAQLLALEDLGFYEKGKAGIATLSGKTTFGGEIVVNPSGGLKASGHPVGATGVKQVAYLTKLIQQDQFPLALAHNVGGSGATAIVHIIGKV